MSDLAVVWLVVVPLEEGDDPGCGAMPVNVRCIYATRESAVREAKRINRVEGRRDTGAQAFVEDRMVQP